MHISDTTCIQNVRCCHGKRKDVTIEYRSLATFKKCASTGESLRLYEKGGNRDMIVTHIVVDGPEDAFAFSARIAGTDITIHAYCWQTCYPGLPSEPHLVMDYWPCLICP